MARAGSIGRWYSAVGNECTTVGAALCLAPGDALSTVHRDLGAILATYLDIPRLAPEVFAPEERTAWDLRRPPPQELLHRLACQVLGRREGFTRGVDRSFHYGLLNDAWGIRHVGMISHLGAMLPVAAGLALASVQRSSGSVVLAFIGEGATSQGDFHEALNMAGVLKLPLVVVIENNRFAFTTALEEQYACERLSSRAEGYGVAGETLDGTDLTAVVTAMERACTRARGGHGATLLECMLPRMRGHAEGDGSYELIPAEERARFLTMDPLPPLEALVKASGAAEEPWLQRASELATTLVEAAVERALAAPEPEVREARRSMYAPGEVREASNRQASEAPR
jgi:2-oxoisovalerate dehydrogenase E1 component